MSLAHGTSIVTSGLVNLYDFKNPKSYSGSGATWFDLKKNSNLEIVGSPTYNANGHITLGTNQITQYVYSASFPMPVDDHTITVVYKVEDFTQSTQAFFTYNHTTDMNYFLTHVEGPTTIRVYRKQTSVLDYTVPSMTNKWCVFTRNRVKSTGVENYYLDGKLIGTATRDVGESSITNGRLFLGQEVDSYSAGFSMDAAQNLDGSIAFFSVYDRALTDSEVAINFEALRGRYGI